MLDIFFKNFKKLHIHNLIFFLNFKKWRGLDFFRRKVSKKFLLTHRFRHFRIWRGLDSFARFGNGEANVRLELVGRYFGIRLKVLNEAVRDVVFVFALINFRKNFTVYDELFLTHTINVHLRARKNSSQMDQLLTDQFVARLDHLRWTVDVFHQILQLADFFQQLRHSVFHAAFCRFAEPFMEFCSKIKPIVWRTIVGAVIFKWVKRSQFLPATTPWHPSQAKPSNKKQQGQIKHRDT